MKSIDILLIEDNPGDVVLITKALESAKFMPQVSVASDGEVAIEALQSCKEQGAKIPDLILLDLNLPKMSGREVLEVIKSDDRLSNIPVIILTSSREDKDVVGLHQMDPNSYIIKPSNLNGFKDVISSIEAFYDKYCVSHLDASMPTYYC